MSRTYKIGDKDVPSVTTVCSLLDKPELNQWRINLCIDYIKDKVLDIEELNNIDDIMEEAKYHHKTVLEGLADSGTDMHQAIAELLAGEKNPLYANQKMQDGCEAAIKMLNRHNVKVLGSECFCWSDDYAGTLDLICEIDENIFKFKKDWVFPSPRVIAIIDFKSSKTYYLGHKIQLAGYMGCKNSNKISKKVLTSITHCGIMRIRDGRVNVKAFNEPKWTKIFNALLEIYKLQ